METPVETTAVQAEVRLYENIIDESSRVNFKELLIGESIRDILRYGKYLIFIFEFQFHKIYIFAFEFGIFHYFHLYLHM